MIPRRKSGSVAAVVVAMLALPGVGFAGQVDRATAARAAKIVFSIDYLPFRHLENGCNSRAIYMGMELADAGIPSVQQYAQGKSQFTLAPFPGQSWDYHTAPLVWVAGDAEPTVLDPSLATGPLARSAWVARLHATSGLWLFWADVATLGVGDRSDEMMGPTSRDRLPRGVSELAGFRGGDLMFASREMCSHLEDETGVAPEETARKKRKLETRTHELLQSLDRKKLLHEYEVSGISGFGC